MTTRVGRQARLLERVLVVVDEAGATGPAVAAALELAGQAGRVLAVSVVDVQKCCVDGEEDLGPVQRRLEETVERLREAGLPCEAEIRRVVNRNISHGLRSTVAEFQPTLVMIGADEGPGWVVALGDRPSLTMLRRAGCPVLVVPRDQAG